MSQQQSIAFEIAELERDRALTIRQLREVSGEFVLGMGAYQEKWEGQLARIDKRLAELLGQW